MTEPVIIISGTAPVGGSKERNRGSQENIRRTGVVGHTDDVESDSVDISEEARERASGRRRKTILEYLEDEN